MSDTPLGRAHPEKIGRYAIEKLIGQGGMGCVYLARDSILKRLVAVKILRPDLDIAPQEKEKLVWRMRHEAEAAAALSHPNIVTLHDMGQDDSVGLYLVFEYVEGPTLRARISKAALPLAEVATLSRALGAAITCAHAAGVIHRDIKPENILLAKTGPKIADFGVARIPDSIITQVNVVLGTPAYTAPEALASAEYGPASDQFSLAATLYEALSGARAFDGDDALDVVKKIATDDPKPLEGLECDPRIVARMTSVLRRGLAKDKGERYATAEDLGTALAMAVESRVITEAPPSSARILLSPLPSASPFSPGNETPFRPSVIIRKKTQRIQNLFAALGLVVIVALILFGRRNNEESPLRDAASAIGSATDHPNDHPPTHTDHAEHASASATHRIIPIRPVRAQDAGTTAALPAPSSSTSPLDSSSSATTPSAGVPSKAEF